ncbi:biotin/lipoate--protein ligase family protein [Shimia biformata]|uniref:biotin/lipoate--protein ligase family protein n=1 Tax=Shimia biformata TaxID=1294299 RepID=UPI0019522446|nr:biotin/lipoate--protein ligase family protein [Shimia biformata]
MSETPTFPPLMYGEAAPTDAMEHGAMRAALGCDAGLIAYRLDPAEMQAALVFAPEVPLRQAMAMLPLCGVGFQNALGALAPPEVAVHLEWDGGIRINGASCGRFQAAASDNDPDAVPDWLLIGFTLPLLPPTGDMGHTPDQTALFAEGCAEVAPPALLEAWARHTLNWITRWEDEGTRPLHAEWRGLAHGIGEAAQRGDLTGTFLGVDEDFGMLLRDDAGETHLIPLTTVMEDTP